MAQEDIAIASVSVLLYAALAITSAYYYLKFRHIIKMKNSNPHCDYGRYDEPKIIFFLVLLICATLDLPMYIGCLAEGGPTDCEWDSVTYPIFWSMHLLALCGYAFSIVTPPVLWSDIINQKDGKLWFSAYPMDGTKWFFQIALFCFWSVMSITVLLVILFYHVSDHKKFTQSSVLNAVSSIMEPALTFLISAGCLYCGVRLQQYVMRVKLEGAKEIRFLFHLNVTLLIILATYLSRSLMVLRLFSWMSPAYTRAFSCSYFVWMLVTRWLPYIFCSFCLINEMRFTGAQIADKYNRHASTVLNTTTNSMLKSNSSHSLLFSADSLSLSQMQNSYCSSHGGSSGEEMSSQLRQSLLGHGQHAADYCDEEESFDEERGDRPGPTHGGVVDSSFLEEEDEEDSYLMSGDAANTYDDAVYIQEYMRSQQSALEQRTQQEAADALEEQIMQARYATESTASSEQNSERASWSHKSPPQVDYFMPRSSFSGADDTMFSADTSF